MLTKISRHLYVLLVLVVVLAVGLLAVRRIPRAREGVAIVGLKLTGSLSDISWGDLYRIYKTSRNGRRFNLPDLATTPNPYAVLVNPFGSPEDVSAGSDLFRSHCSTCHGSNGSGGAGGPVLQHRQMVHGGSDWAIFKTVSMGVPGTAMPSSTLSWTDKWLLVAYVRSLTLHTEQPFDESAVPTGATAPVSYEDILHAGQLPDRWLTYSGSYDAHRFSPAVEITPANVANLRLLWQRQYDISEPSLETSPLVVDGRMFVTVPPSRVEALDVRTGSLIWAYDRELPKQLNLCCGYVNRGLAVLGSMLYFGTLDGHLIALDINTGRVGWDIPIADYKAGYSITGAPLALKNLVLTGVAGGEYGIRGFVEALDATTGKEVWRFETIPQPGRPGLDTWKGDSWKTGGGPTWLTGSFDPDANVVYWPVGNPSPEFDGDARAGNNLYTNCVVALNADDGTLRWYFQFTAHDAFDWDATEIPVLLNMGAKGDPRHYLVQANRNAFYYVLDREKGEFQLARPFGHQTWAKMNDGKKPPEIDPTAYPTVRGTALYPGTGGATNWQSPSYSPLTGLVYIPALDRGGVFFKSQEGYHKGEFFFGGSFQFFPNVQPEGAVRALNAVTAEQQWEYRNPAFHVGGLLSTAGGVVFGSQQDSFFALDAKTGHELWRVHTNSRIVASPISFLQKGEQMVTIAAGRDLLTFGL